MKNLSSAAIFFRSITVCMMAILTPLTSQAEEEIKKESPPKGELNETEEKFVGKWLGSRSNFTWEIERKDDRTFEIAFIEPDPESPLKVYKNYAVGVWWIEGKEYKYEWTKWWGDEGDFGGVNMEKIKKVTDDKVITLSDDDVDPNNVEVRVQKFKMSAWDLKPNDN